MTIPDLSTGDTITEAWTDAVTDATNGTDWTPFAFVSPWEDLGLGFRDCEYRKVNNVVHLRGMAETTGAVSAGADIVTLPAGFRPGLVLVVATWSNSGAARLNVRTDGVIDINTAMSANGWISFDGVSFTLD